MNRTRTPRISRLTEAAWASFPQRPVLRGILDSQPVIRLYEKHVGGDLGIPGEKKPGFLERCIRPTFFFQSFSFLLICICICAPVLLGFETAFLPDSIAASSSGHCFVHSDTLRCLRRSTNSTETYGHVSAWQCKMLGIWNRQLGQSNAIAAMVGYLCGPVYIWIGQSYHYQPVEDPFFS